MFIDIDHFKRTNDMYGHKVGDQVLVEVANLLGKSTRKYDIISRHGGDEFLIYFPISNTIPTTGLLHLEYLMQIGKIIVSENVEVHIS